MTAADRGCATRPGLNRLHCATHVLAALLCASVALATHAQAPNPPSASIVLQQTAQPLPKVELPPKSFKTGRFRGAKSAARTVLRDC